MQFLKEKLHFISLAILVGITGCVPDKDKNSATTKNTNAVTQANVATSINQNLAKNTTNALPADNLQCNNQVIHSAYQAQNPNQKTQVLGCGQIIKLLKDDTDGTQHQKFLVKIDGTPPMTVLIAHNIDLAHRINNIAVNQPIRFYGEYIYNPKGGVVHWTHKDPAARHQDGWLEYQGQKYQ